MPIKIIALDMYGTLVANGVDLWRVTFEEIVRVQRLPVTAAGLWSAWRQHEVNFRKTRTNMADPASSPPFRTYYQAWRQAFVDTFAALGLPGDPSDAARRCTRDQGNRPAFPDAAAVSDLQRRWRVGVLSNADHGYLLDLIALRGWRFDVVVSSESARAYKPDPRIFAAFCARAGARPDEVLLVGDSAYDDVHGAKSQGLRAALVTRAQDTPGRTPEPEHQRLIPPDFQVSSLLDLGAALDRWSADG
ncbi:MAG: HAD family hydrolase [SAR202 cluster bacterium]|nr:HAD family hydrolase [SAR202 cluster bacterium]